MSRTFVVRRTRNGRARVPLLRGGNETTHVARAAAHAFGGRLAAGAKRQLIRRDERKAVLELPFDRVDEASDARLLFVAVAELQRPVLKLRKSRS